MSKLQTKITPFDFEIPKLRTFLTVREIALLAVSVLDINNIIAFVSWVILVPPALLSAFELLPIPFHPLMSVVGVAIFSALIVANSMRTN